MDGVTIHNGTRSSAFLTTTVGSLRTACMNESTDLSSFGNVRWYTNLDHGRRHQDLPLMTMADNLKFSKHKEIKGRRPTTGTTTTTRSSAVTDAIPSDYDGMMGVPITFLDKYNPDQFEILGTQTDDNNPGVKTQVNDSEARRTKFWRS